MNSNQSSEIIASSLFDFVVEYAKDIAQGRATIDKSIDGDSALIVFAENFLAQFSKGYLKVTIEGFNSRSQNQLRNARRRLERRKSGNKTDAAQLLIFHLEPLCDRIPEISYGNSEIEAVEFHIYYFVELMNRIVAWLDEFPASNSLRDAARNAERSYNDAIEQFI
jgi:hypothetical protein